VLGKLEDSTVPDIRKGPSIKYVMLEGEGPRRCDSFLREGSRAWYVTLFKFVIIHMKPEIESNV